MSIMAEVEALLAEGGRCWEAGNFAGAAEAYAEARALAPDHLGACFGHAVTLKKLGQLDAAEATYRLVLAAQPDHGPALGNLAVLLLQIGRTDEAIPLFRRAAVLPGAGFAAWASLGAALMEAGEIGEAVEALEQASRLAPQDPVIWWRLGCARRALLARDGAISALRRAAALDPDDGEVWLDLGNTLFEADRPAEAEAAYRKLLALCPDDAGAHYNLGAALDAQDQLPEAVAAWEAALQCDAGLARAAVRRIHGLMAMCDWRGLTEFAAVADTLGLVGEAVSPGSLVALDDDPARQHARARAYAARYAGISAAPFPPRAAGARIRVGYFSADFHDHATMHLMAGLFRHHDRSRFEVSAWSYGLTREGAQRSALQAHVDHFIDIADAPDAEIARMARSHGLDIAVDLKGYTQDNRFGIFAHRLAPIQIAYLGYPGTSGAPFMDYIVADRVIIPMAERAHYNEHVIRLPGSYQPNDNERLIASTPPSRTALGLPETGFVFACFNNAYKITPREWDIWMRLLGKVEDSVLWLLAANPHAQDNLRRAAAARGINPARLVFAPWANQADHLARQRAADLFLDCFAYNAHTTASDALWTGLPVLTRPGRSFASRVAASLVHAVDLPELVVDSDAAYESTALALARDPARLADLRARLATNRLTQPLFDTAGHARALEAAFAAVHQRHLDGLSPADIG